MERKTKIIATLGPAVASFEGVCGLVEAGMNVARLNFSHGTHESHAQMVSWVRDAADRFELPIAILQDIQGPRIRVGSFAGGAIELTDGDVVHLEPGADEMSGSTIFVENLQHVTLTEGSQIRMSDGLIGLEVTAVDGSRVTARVIEGGAVADHKGVAFPGAPMTVPAVTWKDEADLAFGQEQDVDYVAASFVSSGGDIRDVRRLIGADTPIIAKIESAIGYENLDDILDEAYGTMVARGDLGVELSFESVPRAQKDILARSNARARLTITATEMLESMTHASRPTRAEVTDVFGAVLDGSDAVMLSAETAVGKYPQRTVAAMDRICREAEASSQYGKTADLELDSDDARFAVATAQACVEAADSLGLHAIVAFTESGSTSRLISKFRPRADIYAYTPNLRTYRRMALYAGVRSGQFRRVNSTDEMIIYAEKQLLDEGIVQRGDGVVMAAGIPPNQAASTNLMKLHSIGSTIVGVPTGD
ncbi:MAG TPA: pyruvate kinase [Actinobacteria bacterium]|nr:pyruvate kinase [bacterium BMS3Bbin02]HDL41923.1 pyruvate kinase [Actinomycetota bacterium]